MNVLPDNLSELSLLVKVESLEASVAKLISLCEKLSEENTSFRLSNKQLMHERAELQQKNDKAHVQVSAMIERLKTAEKSS